MYVDEMISTLYRQIDWLSQIAVDVESSSLTSYQFETRWIADDDQLGIVIKM